jgi:hypothetical protein
MTKKPTKRATFHPTTEQKRAIRHYSRLGYSVFVLDDAGRVVPGWCQEQIAVVLDELDRMNRILQPDESQIGRRT